MAFEGSTIDPMWLFPRQLPGSDSQGPRYLSAISSATVFWVPHGSRWRRCGIRQSSLEIGRLLMRPAVAIEDFNPSLKNILDKRFARLRSSRRAWGALFRYSTYRLPLNTR